MGMWNIPLSLFNADTEITFTCTISQNIGNLYAFLGSPSVPNNYTIIVDSCTIANVQITLDFPAGTTFQFSVINGGAIMGLGGAGGDGGTDTTGLYNPGLTGGIGGDAIQSNTFDVSVDVDNGFLYGGGGGGGGGSSWGDIPTLLTYAGGGGGGGRGFLGTQGGDPGLPRAADGIGSGIPAVGGTSGGTLGFGVGGNGANPGTNDGADGGEWGAAGSVGDHGTFAIFAAFGFINWFSRGGLGGRAGNAFRPTSGNGATIIFNGAKDETQLRFENRLKGEIEFCIQLVNHNETNTDADPSTHSITFQNDGELVITGRTTVTTEWQTTGSIDGGPPHAVNNGDNYSVRQSIQDRSEGFLNATNDWDAAPGTKGDWFALTSDRTFSFDYTGTALWYASVVFEIQRTGAPTDEILASGLYLISNDAP